MMRRGSTNRAVVALLLSAVVVACLVVLLSRTSLRSTEVTVYCAAGLREPMEAVRAAYEKERGTGLSIQYGGSSTLLANLRLNHEADVFLPADHSYMDAAAADGLVTYTHHIAQMRPILAVRKNPVATLSSEIHSLDDLLNNGFRISMTDPDAAATGKLVRVALEKLGKWDAFKSHVTVFKGTVSEVAADLQVGAADAGILWDAMLKQLPDLKEAPLPEFSGITAHVAAGVVVSSKHLNEAEALVAFLASSKGQRFFMDAGFSPGPPPL